MKIFYKRVKFIYFLLIIISNMSLRMIFISNTYNPSQYSQQYIAEDNFIDKNIKKDPNSPE